MSAIDLLKLPISELSAQIKARAVSPVELTEAALCPDPGGGNRQRREPPDRGDLEGRIVRREHLEAGVHERERAHRHEHGERAPDVVVSWCRHAVRGRSVGGPAEY